MKDVHCSLIQRMVFKKADYGDFNNNGTFDVTAEIDRKCSILTNCQLKSHCGGSRSCELTIDNNLLSSQYCSDISKEVYTDYICVDTYISLNLKGPNVRFSESPTKGFIEIKDGSTWRKVDEENWDIIRHKMLCRHLGFSETDDHNIGTRNVGSGENIATGDLICYNTQPNGTSCCVNLQRNTTTSIVNLPYAICKICDNPLLQNVTTFPDSVFSGSGSSNFKDARFSGNGWCAAGSGNNYILLDLQKEYHIAQIVVMGNENQTTWSDSYSLKFSHNKTLIDGSSAIQIKGNQNGYQASVTIVDIYNVRYLKIESTRKTEFCLRTELCGEVQLPAPVENITTKSSNFSVDLSWTILGPRQSSYITHFIIYLNGIQLQRISREKYGIHYIIFGLTSYTDYVVGVQAQDGSSHRSVIAYESFKTEEAVPSGPPLDVNFESRGKNSLKVSWKTPDKRLWHGELTGYQVCYSTLESDKNPKCSRATAFLYTIYNLHSSTEYFVTVSAGTKVGYGNKSLEISQITNGEPINPFATSYYTLSLNIPKPAEYIKGVMVIVHNATAGSSIPSANFQTNNLGPFQENIQDLYVTAYLKADVLPLTFVIGDGKEYNSEKQKYFNQPLKQNSSYIVFLRFFESNDSYYSTEWSSSVKTMVKPPDNDTCVQKTESDKCCKFPFDYKGKTYYSCTKKGYSWGIIGYSWCYYDEAHMQHEACKEPIYRPTTQPTPSTKPTEEQRMFSQTSSSLNVTATSALVPLFPSHEIHPSRPSISSPSRSTTTVMARSGTEKRSSKRDVTKQNMYIILGCGVSGGILLVMIIALTVIIYLKRKNKMKVKKEEEEEEGDQHEMTSYRLTDATNNPVYESIDKDLDIKSDEEQQALQPPHIYQELEDPQGPTSCTHEYSTPYETSMSNNDGPKITPALNDTDSFAHFNELYETS
ncbi:Receptor-type tyrosine- phosphatase F [Paramuricea clavata]|uniref:Receptor-type tyrosine- phosphatase F n=1 Tax=Paramuricea clavata TaxID=317549 RepID=A0A7D9EDC7_PARCT|nr:Receptor-type tyrosine- phosphatase F [Paramuricea clavata]